MPWMQINTFRISSVFYIWIQLQKGHRDPNQFKTQDETSAYGKCANTKNKLQIEKKRAPNFCQDLSHNKVKTTKNQHIS